MTAPENAFRRTPTCAGSASTSCAHHLRSETRGGGSFVAHVVVQESIFGYRLVTNRLILSCTTADPRLNYTGADLTSVFPHRPTPVRGGGPSVAAKEVTVPLSEHEQKMLEQMERALYAEDPKFATQMKGSERAAGNRRRILLGVAIALVGLVLVVVGVSTQQVVVGGIGFAVMVAGVAWAVTPERTTRPLAAVGTDGKVQPGQKQARKKGPKRAGKPGKSGTFMQRMEARWEQRRHDQGGL